MTPAAAESASKPAGDVPTASRMSKFTFFRQSGWMILASTVSGALMYAVHKAAGQMPKDEYGVFTTLLQILNQMAIPAAGLQLTFVHQAVSAESDAERQRLTGTMRALMKGTFFLWGLMAALALVFSDALLRRFQITNPAALWITMLLGLISLWSPIILGVLQGRQNFFWLGWANMLNGLTRLGSVVVIVLLLGGWAAGGMTGALLGMLVAVGIGLWQTADLWRGPAAPFDWLPWLRRMVPITLGFGAVTFMLTQDMLVVQEFFPREETGYYGAAGMIGRALYFFTAPVTAVLFPKLVQSAARAQKNSVLAQAVGATALLGVGAATFCTLFPTLPLRLVYNETFLKVAPLVPLFAWCMLPLILSGVLVNNLLARERFAAVPFLVAVAAGYYITLRFRHDSFETVIHTLGFFGSLLLAVCLFLTWREGRTAIPAP
jgi:O-antigen/teichoic acid export membrane protein